MAKKKPQAAYLAAPEDEPNFDALDQFLGGLEASKPAQELPNRGVLRGMADVALAGGRGAVQGVRMFTDLAGSDNATSRGLRTVEDFIGGLRSAQAKQDDQEAAAILKAAENAGILDQVVAGAKAFAVAPVSTMAQAVGTSLPTIAAALIPGGQGLAAARLAGTLGVGAAQGAGSVKGQIYDTVKQELLQAGASPEEAEQRALQASSYAQSGGKIATGAALGAAAGSTGMERAIGALSRGVAKEAPGMARRVLVGGVTEAVPEFAQGAQEKLAGNQALYEQGFDVAPGSGVIAAGTMEGLAGFGMGAAAGLPRPAVRAGDQLRAEGLQPERGPFTRGSNKLVETAAAKVDFDPSLLAAGRKLQGMAGLEQAGTAPGAAAPKQTFGNEIDYTPEPDTGRLAIGDATEIAKANIARTAAKHEPMPQDVADGIVAKATERGLNMVAVPHPEGGGFTVVPRQWVTAAMAAPQAAPAGPSVAERAMRAAESLTLEGDPAVAAAQQEARRAQIQSAPVDRAPRVRTPEPAAPAPAVPADLVQAYVESRRNDGTPAGRFFAGEFDAGRITRDEVQGLIDAARPKSPDQRLAEAAALAPKPQAPQPGDILNPKGEPFRNMRAAEKVAQREGGSVIVVDGGWSVRPKEADARTSNAPEPGGPAGEPVADARRGAGTGELRDQRPADVQVGAAGTADEVLAGDGAAAVQPGRTGVASELTTDIPTLKRQWQAAVQAGDGATARAINDRIVALKANAAVQPTTEAPASQAAAPGAVAADPKADVPAAGSAAVEAAGVAQSAIAATDQAPVKQSPSASDLVKVMTVFGTNTYVRQSDLQGDEDRLIRQFTKDGKNNGRIARGNLDPTGEKRAADAREVAANPLFNLITRKDGAAFANRTAAKRELMARGLEGSHEVVPASDVKPGVDGFVVRKKATSAPAAPESAASTTQGEGHGQTQEEAQGLLKKGAPGTKFLHRRVMDQSGTGQQLYEVTRHGNGGVYYRAIYDGRLGGKSEWASVEDFARIAMPADRSKYADGRTVPQVGDRVYTETAGFGGGTASVSGEVRAGSNGPFVAITGAASMLGEQAGQKRVPLTKEWTIKGEEHPNVRARRESAERLEAEATERRNKRESMLNEAAERNGTLDTNAVNVGDTLELADGTQGTVTSIDRLGIFVDGRSIGNDMRGVKRVQAATATHADPGEAAEPATPAVVKESLAKAAKREDVPIRDVKAAALRLIDDAIDKAPSSAEVDSQIGVNPPHTIQGKKVMTGVRRFTDDKTVMVEARETRDGKWTVTDESYDGSGTGSKRRTVLGEIVGAPAVAREQLMSMLRRIKPDGTLANPDMVSIDIPGDGTFKVMNTKERLAEFRKRVESSPGFKSQRPGPTEPLRVNGYGTRQNPGSAFGVEGGSGPARAAIEGMIDEGDAQAAVDYAAMKGLDLAEVLKGQPERLKKVHGLTPTSAEPEPAPAAEPPAPQPEKQEAAPAENRLDNFGEALPPARRNMAAKLTEDLADDDIAKRPLSEIWPLAENEAIEDSFAAAVAHAARAEIPSKPRQPYKLRLWVEKVKTLRGLAGRIVSGEVTRDRMGTLIDTQFRSLRDWWSKVQLLEDVSRDQWKRIGSVEERPDAITYEDGKQLQAPTLRIEIDGKGKWLHGDVGVDGADRGTVGGNKAGIMAMLAAAEPEQRMKFEIRRNTNTGEVFINKEGDAERRRLMTFASVEEARKAIAEQYDELVSQWEGVKARDNITERDLRGAENRPRAGKDHRQGRDVTPNEFQQTFGFRGGEFGKWVEQGKGDKERQALLNSAFDALMDLSDMLHIPPRAISLNGTLGIAFGSRGSGWASAHFEPSNLVINLTKTRGAGTLAHEWFHALDNYFSRLRRDGEEAKFTGDKDKYRNDNYITHQPEALMVRKDRSRHYSPMTASALKARHAARQQKESRTGWPPADAYAPENWERDPSIKTDVRPEVEVRFADLVKALNDSPMTQRSRRLDKGARGYWGSTLERAARAFESFVQARMQEQGYHNDFLANVLPVEEMRRNPERYPYLLPGEVKPIADAFDALFSEVKTREDDAGNVAMFSRSGASTGRRVDLGSAQALADQLASTGLIRLNVVQSVSDMPLNLQRQLSKSAPDGRVRGAYFRGTDEVWMVADHIRGANEFVEVALHEAFHRGLGKTIPDAKPLLREIWRTNQNVRKATADQMRQHGIGRDEAIEEALAKMAEAGEVRDLKGWPKLLEAIRTWLGKMARAVGIEMVWTDDMVADLVAASTREGLKAGVHADVAAQASASRGNPIWYSALNRAMLDSPMNAGTASAWVQYIDAMTKRGVVKADEIEWTGLKDWLALQTSKITKDQISEYLSGNAVRVTETQSPVGESIGRQDFRTWQLPGGTNYREVLLTLPPAARKSRFDVLNRKDKTILHKAETREAAQVWIADHQGMPAARGAEVVERTSGQAAAPEYKSSHWDQKNVLAHIRVNDRTDADGKRVLFVEEIQSDWGQGLKRGEEVPNAPFIGKTDAWVSLAIKRIIHMAATEGYDRVAFVNGEQSAERYDLSKQIDAIEYVRRSDSSGLYDITAKRDHSPVVRKEKQTQAELEALVGKDITQRIVEAKSSFGTLSGVDLKVGGEGMRAFYDKIVPAVAKDVLRKVGGGSLNTVELSESGFMTNTFGGRSAINGFSWRASGFDITPAMREKAAGGMPLFKRAPAVTVETDEATGAPVYATDDISIGFPQETERFEYVLQDGEKIVNYSIGPADGFDSYGFVELVIGADGIPKALADIEIRPDLRGQAIGEKVMAAILGAHPGTDIEISNIVEGARGFWAKMGVPEQNRAAGEAYDGTLNYQTFQEAQDERAANRAATGRGAAGEGRNASAEDRAQGADGQAQGLMLSRAEPADATDMRSAPVVRQIQQRAHDLLATRRTFNWWHRTVGTQYHKAQVDADFGKVYTAAQDFIHDTSAFANDPADLAPDLLPQLKNLGDLKKTLGLNKRDRESMASAVFEGTLDWMRDDSGQPVKAGPDDTAGIVWTPAELRERFGFNDRQVKLYEQFRASVDRSLDTLVASDVVRLLGSELPPGMRALVSSGDLGRFKGLVTAYLQDAPGMGDLADQVNEKYARIEELKARGYAPLMRFGRYTVDVVSEDGERKFFGLYESESEANRAARQFKEGAEPGDEVTQGVLSEEAYKQFQGMTPETLELFAEVAGVEKNDVFQEYLRRAKNNRSALKRLIHRKGIAGYSEDASRVLAQFLTSNARAASSNLHMGEMAKAVQDIPKQKGDVIDEAIRLREYVQNPQEEAQAIRGLLFASFLGGSVASAMVNLTQPLMMTFPYLSQFGGPAKAASRLMGAMGAALGNYDRESALGKALAMAEKEGIVSPQEMHQLQAEASGSLAKHPAWRRLTFAWSSLFSAAEQFNRRLSFVAAYETAVAEGKADPAAFAAKAVEETQGVYNKGNKPRWARGTVGAVAFTFKQYSVSYMEFLKRLPTRERTLALAVLLLAAGAQGMPGADDLDDLIDTLGQGLGYDTNAKLWKTRVLSEAIGSDGADFVLRGFSALPGFPLDVAGRLGLGNMIPGTGLLLKSKQDKAGEVAEALGPAASLAKGVAGAVPALTTGNVAGVVEGIAPKAMKDLVKALEMYRTGEYRDTKGRKVTDADATDALVKGLGFQPAQVARDSRRVQMANQQIALAKATEAEFADAIARARVDGEPDAERKARQRLADWNASNPESRIVITPAQLARRARELRTTRDDRFVRTAPKEMRQSIKELVQ